MEFGSMVNELNGLTITLKDLSMMMKLQIDLHELKLIFLNKLNIHLGELDDKCIN